MVFVLTAYVAGFARGQRNMQPKTKAATGVSDASRIYPITKVQLNDRTALAVLRRKIDAALESVRDESGLSVLKTGRISFDRSGTSAKITVEAEALVDGKSKDEIAFETYARMMGVRDGIHVGSEFSLVGSEFSLGGDLYRITGYDAGRSKRPVLAKRFANGKTYVFPIDSVNAFVK